MFSLHPFSVQLVCAMISSFAAFNPKQGKASIQNELPLICFSEKRCGKLAPWSVSWEEAAFPVFPFLSEKRSERRE